MGAGGAAAATGDALAPPLDAALASLRRLEWVGLTDLMSESLCLLHYQSNGSLPAACVCRGEGEGAGENEGEDEGAGEGAGREGRGAGGGGVVAATAGAGAEGGGGGGRIGGSSRKLGAWNETRSRRRDPSSLPAPLLERLDAMTAVDAALFAAALRLLLGRLRTVEAATGQPLLRCLDWAALWRGTRYVPGLWDGKDEGLLLPSAG